MAPKRPDRPKKRSNQPSRSSSVADSVTERAQAAPLSNILSPRPAGVSKPVRFAGQSAVTKHWKDQPNRGKKWTKEMEDLLDYMRSQDINYDIIAQEFGKSPLACRLHRHQGKAKRRNAARAAATRASSASSTSTVRAAQKDVLADLYRAPTRENAQPPVVSRPQAPTQAPVAVNPTHYAAMQSLVDAASAVSLLREQQGNPSGPRHPSWPAATGTNQAHYGSHVPTWNSSAFRPVHWTHNGAEEALRLPLPTNTQQVGSPDQVDQRRHTAPQARLPGISELLAGVRFPYKL